MPDRHSGTGTAGSRGGRLLVTDLGLLLRVKPHAEMLAVDRGWPRSEVGPRFRLAALPAHRAGMLTSCSWIWRSCPRPHSVDSRCCRASARRRAHGSGCWAGAIGRTWRFTGRSSRKAKGVAVPNCSGAKVARATGQGEGLLKQAAGAKWPALVRRADGGELARGRRRLRHVDDPVGVLPSVVDAGPLDDRGCRLGGWRGLGSRRSPGAMNIAGAGRPRRPRHFRVGRSPCGRSSWVSRKGGIPL